jgi:hypothetical protein
VVFNCNKSKSLECCEHESDLRTTAGIHVSDRQRGDTHLAEELVVVRECALDQLESRHLVEVLEL